MTCNRLGEVDLLLKFQLSSSYGLGVDVHWRYFHKGLLIEVINQLMSIMEVFAEQPQLQDLLNKNFPWRGFSGAQQNFRKTWNKTESILCEHKFSDLKPRLSCKWYSMNVYHIYQIFVYTREIFINKVNSGRAVAVGWNHGGSPIFIFEIYLENCLLLSSVHLEERWKMLPFPCF